MRLASFVALVFMVGSVTATAQPARGTVFVSASGFAAIETAPTFGGLGVASDGDSSTVAGGALGLGVHLTERLSARLEWSLTGALKQSQGMGGYPLFLGGGLTDVFAFGPGTNVPTTPGLTSLSFAPESIESKRSTSAAFALLGYHLGGGRTSLELLGGLGLLNQDVTTRYVYDRRRFGGLGLPFPIADDKTSSYHAVAVVGADLAVTLTGHAAIVPQVRVYALNGGLSVRPGVGLRWTF